MSEHTWNVIAIIIYMSVMLGIGYWSYRQTDEYEDYVLADRGLNPFVAALSAGAADMSGWLLMGLPGALFVSGMSKLWIAVGLLVGAWANWTYVAPRLRSYSEVADDSVTIPSFFSLAPSSSSCPCSRRGGRGVPPGAFAPFPSAPRQERPLKPCASTLPS